MQTIKSVASKISANKYSFEEVQQMKRSAQDWLRQNGLVGKDS